jgi:hypothetical protein
MFNQGWTASMRRRDSLRVLLGCVLMSTVAWSQFTDAGPADAGKAGVSSTADAGPADAGVAGAPAVPDAGLTDAGIVGPLAGADAGPADARRVEVTLHGITVTVTASSVLADAKDAGRYGPANLLDEDPGTVWAEGAKGSGAGEWVELSFPPNTPVHAFLVTPGNPKSARLYKANARPRKARLELKLVEGRKLDYELDFPRDFPAGGAIYVHYERKFAVHSARLTVLTVWPGSRYPDLCLGGFVPVFRGAEERYSKPFLGEGRDLAPTLAKFMRSPRSIDDLLPAETSKVAAWLRTYPEVPHRGPLPAPEEEYDMVDGPRVEWRHYRKTLDHAVLGALRQSELFRLLPEPGERRYVFDPIGPSKEGSSSHFRVHWGLVEGSWRLVGLDVKYWEQTGDD